MRRLQLALALACLATTPASANRSLVHSDHKPTRREVKQLVDQLTTKKANDAVDKLLGFGPDLVPFVMPLLDDRRLMGVPGIGYRVQLGDLQEAFASYAPKQIVDCLTTILYFVTEAKEVECADLAEGGTDAQRSDCVRAWRRWWKAHPNGR